MKKKYNNVNYELQKTIIFGTRSDKVRGQKNDSSQCTDDTEETSVNFDSFQID